FSPSSGPRRGNAAGCSVRVGRSRSGSTSRSPKRPRRRASCPKGRISDKETRVAVGVLTAEAANALGSQPRVKVVANEGGTMKGRFLISVALAAALFVPAMSTANSELMRLMADPNNWAIWGGDYGGQRYSQLDQINA